MNFKSKLPAAVQLKLDKWEEWYSNYKETALLREVIETVVFVLVMVIIIRFLSAKSKLGFHQVQ